MKALARQAGGAIFGMQISEDLALNSFSVLLANSLNMPRESRKSVSVRISEKHGKATILDLLVKDYDKSRIHIPGSL